MSHLAELVASAKAAINEASDVAALDNVRVEYLGKKGLLTLQMTTLLKSARQPARLSTKRKSRSSRRLTRVSQILKAPLLTRAWPRRPSMSLCRGVVLRTVACIR